MGNVYKDLGRSEDAVKCYQTAIRILPNFADAYSNLAATMKDIGQPLELKPNLSAAFANYVHTKNFVCDWENRENDFAKLSQLIQEQLGDVSTISTAVVTSTGVLPVLPSVQPFHTLTYPLSMSEILQISKRYAQKSKLNVSLTAEGAHYTHHPKPQSVRLKSKYIIILWYVIETDYLCSFIHIVGYVSSYFGNHPLSHLMQ